MDKAKIESICYEIDDLYLRIGSLIKKLPNQYNSLDRSKIMTKENNGIIK